MKRIVAKLIFSSDIYNTKQNPYMNKKGTFWTEFGVNYKLSFYKNSNFGVNYDISFYKIAIARALILGMWGCLV
jgi:hypothetical protein